MMLILDSFFAIDYARDLSQQQTGGRERLLAQIAHPQAGIDRGGLLLLYSSPEVVMERYPVLVKHRLSLFRNSNK
jgi:hypothetical protein